MLEADFLFFILNLCMVNWQVHIGFGRVQPDKYETGPFTGLRSGLILITLIWVAIWYLTKKKFHIT